MGEGGQGNLKWQIPLNQPNPSNHLLTANVVKFMAHGRQYSSRLNMQVTNVSKIKSSLFTGLAHFPT
jgi:hypothetical protein